MVWFFQGSGIYSSSIVNGMVFKRFVEGDVTKVTDAKICVLSCPLDSMTTETKVSEIFFYSSSIENNCSQ